MGIVKAKKKCYKTQVRNKPAQMDKYSYIYWRNENEWELVKKL